MGRYQGEICFLTAPFRTPKSRRVESSPCVLLRTVGADEVCEARPSRDRVVSNCNQENVLWLPSDNVFAEGKSEKALRETASGRTYRDGRIAETVDDRGGTTPSISFPFPLAARQRPVTDIPLRLLTTLPPGGPGTCFHLMGYCWIASLAAEPCWPLDSTLVPRR